MQKSTGAIQMTYQYQNLDLGTWRADRIWWPRDPNYPNDPTKWNGTGRFQIGPAMGTAVAISTIGGNQHVYWWSEEVEII